MKYSVIRSNLRLPQTHLRGSLKERYVELVSQCLPLLRRHILIPLVVQLLHVLLVIKKIRLCANEDHVERLTAT